MEFGFWDAIQILGALAFFVYGMKVMSDGVQRAAGSQLRNILRTMTKNRFLGVFTGFLITALVQSSSATTVMTVSFVNANLLSLVESAGVMMGANIGTTITGWLVSILGFKVKLAHYSIPLFAAAIPMLFSSRGKFKYWGEFILGFGILFLGLSYLKEAVPDLKGNPEVLDFLANFTNWGIGSRILFVLIGALVTIVVQSSSAAMAITLTMCAQGWLPFEVAASMILGENIGTTITAELASLVGNTNSKRSARIHSMFNIIGVTWMVIILPYFLPFLSNLIQDWFGAGDPYANADAMPVGLSAFHTAFNLLNVILLLGFVPWLVKAAVWSVKSREDDEDDQMGLKYIGSGSFRTPELATIELQKEAAEFGRITAKMNNFTMRLLNSTDKKEQKKMLKKISKYEKITDKIEIDITEYMSKLLSQEVTIETSDRMRCILNIANDLERIGDIYFQISMAIERKNEGKDYFVTEQRDNLNAMFELIEKAFAVMQENLDNPSYSSVSKETAVEAEKAINEMRNKMRKKNLKKIGSKDYNPKAAMIYSDLFASLEKVGDHIMNVSESVVGEI